jgi:hypothetical protein
VSPAETNILPEGSRRVIVCKRSLEGWLGSWALRFTQVELRGEELLFFQGGRVARKHRLQDLRTVRVRDQGCYVLFNNREELEISSLLNRWEEMASFLSYAADLANARRRELDQTQEVAVVAESEAVEDATVSPPVDLVPTGSTVGRHLKRVLKQAEAVSPRGPGEVCVHYKYAAFPNRCICCKGPATIARRLSASFGWITYPSSYFSFGVSVPVPVCGACNFKRTMVGIVVCLLFLASAAVVVVAAGSYWDSYRADLKNSLLVIPMVFGLLAMILLPINAAVFWLPRLVDWHVLGVRVMKVDRTNNRILLKCADPALAAEVEALTAQNQQAFLDGD